MCYFFQINQQARLRKCKQLKSIVRNRATPSEKLFLEGVYQLSLLRIAAQWLAAHADGIPSINIIKKKIYSLFLKFSEQDNNTEIKAKLKFSSR